jgi:hypothetical protein
LIQVPFLPLPNLLLLTGFLLAGLT